MTNLIELEKVREKRANNKLSELVKLVRENPRKAMTKISEICNGEKTAGGTEREGAAYFLGYLFALSCIKTVGIDQAINETMEGFLRSVQNTVDDYDYKDFV